MKSRPTDPRVWFRPLPRWQSPAELSERYQRQAASYLEAAQALGCSSFEEAVQRYHIRGVLRKMAELQRE